MTKAISQAFQLSINAAVINSPLSTLQVGRVRNLGPYANTTVNFGVDITDYSGVVLDPARNRVLIFGGGHDGCNETDIRSFDLPSLTWSSLYPSMPYSEMQIPNCDSVYGRWISTNHPFTRHSWLMQVVVGNRLYLMTPKGMPYGINGLYEAHWGGRICWFDFDTGLWSYSSIASEQTPWFPAGAAKFDAACGKILVVTCESSGSGYMGLWLYNPVNDSIEQCGPAVNTLNQIIGDANALVYVPDNDRYYAIQPNRDYFSYTQVWEIALNRANPVATTVTLLTTSGAEPMPLAGLSVGANYSSFAWDSTNKVIGGYVQAGKFFAFDPFSKIWSSHQMKNEDGSDFTLSEAFHCLEYDPSSGCFIFLSTVDVALSHAYRFGAQ